MSMPNLKRVRIFSELELSTWLDKNSGHESVMLVTHSDASHKKHVSREQISDVLAKHGWKEGFKYTLSSTLLGHVISR